MRDRRRLECLGGWQDVPLECVNCAGRTACAGCVGDVSCGWCAGVGSCQAAEPGGAMPTTCTDGWSYGSVALCP